MPAISTTNIRISIGGAEFEPVDPVPCDRAPEPFGTVSRPIVPRPIECTLKVDYAPAWDALFPDSTPIETMTINNVYTPPRWLKAKKRRIRKKYRGTVKLKVQTTSTLPNPGDANTLDIGFRVLAASHWYWCLQFGVPRI